jgi:hypothetical protein
MSSGLELTTEEELKRRLDALMTRLHVKCMEIAPHVKLIGDYRLEAQVIYDELQRRGVVQAYAPPPFEDVGQISLSGTIPS